MKKLALIALAGSALIATPAFAAAVSTDATGTINITGTVAGKCSVVTGTGTSATFGTTVALGELAQADGTLLASSTLSSTFNTAGGSALTARVVCTTANPKISVDADPLVSATTTATGYANTVHFEADVLVAKAATASQTYSNDSNAAAGTATALGDRLAATGNNVTVSTSNWRTLTTGALMVAATDYAGKITVTITPL